MSSVYLTEPPTQGKVLIKTSYGDIDVELWSREAPLACRNFIQLSMEGYYDNTIIHRIIKGFMVQMGDPSGTGQGGKSIWGRPFKDELHGRLKFNHRGILAMANENAPNTNHSQFFITLDACEWLNRKHTIFGKVTGNTMFNVLRMAEVEVDSNDRPVDVELTIKSIEVLWNPFDDIVPRNLGPNKGITAAAAGGDPIKGDRKEPKPVARKAVKDKKLLSFGGDDGEEEDDGGNDLLVDFTKSRTKDGATKDGASQSKQSQPLKVKMHSSHDSKFKDKKLSSKVPVDLTRSLQQHQGDVVEDEDRGEGKMAGKANENGRGRLRGDESRYQEMDAVGDEEGYDRSMKEQLMKSRSLKDSSQRSESSRGASHSADLDYDDSNVSADLDGDSNSGNSRSHMNALIADATRGVELRQKSAEFKHLREQLLRSRRAVNVLTGAEAEKVREDRSKHDLVTPLEQRRQKYLKRKSDHGDRAEDTMSKLMKFTQSIRASKGSNSTSNGKHKGQTGEEKEAEHYYGQILDRGDYAGGGGDSGGAAAEEEDLKDWFQGKLKCRKHVDDSYRQMHRCEGDANGASGRGGSSSSSSSAGGRSSSSSSSLSAVAAVGAAGSDGRSLDDYVVIDPRKQHV